MIETQSGGERHRAEQGEGADKHDPGDAVGGSVPVEVVAQVVARRGFDYPLCLFGDIHGSQIQRATTPQLAGTL